MSEIMPAKGLPTLLWAKSCFSPCIIPCGFCEVDRKNFLRSGTNLPLPENLHDLDGTRNVDLDVFFILPIDESDDSGLQVHILPGEFVHLSLTASGVDAEEKPFPEIR